MAHTRIALTLGLMLSEFFACIGSIGLLYFYSYEKFGLVAQIDQLLLLLLLAILVGFQFINMVIDIIRKDYLSIRKGFFLMFCITFIGGGSLYLLNSLDLNSSNFAYMYVSSFSIIVFVIGLLTIIIALLLSLQKKHLGLN